MPGNEPTPSLEAQEREAAFRRGEAATPNADDQRDSYTGVATPGVAHRAFAALAENVRDYAIFLLDPNGIITFWGEGARHMKGWTKDQTEGAHLRLLYPDGGAEDGTAESHIETAIKTGEYSGQGQRVRADGSTFWAAVTLTALRSTDDQLLGFAKTTRDLTAHRAAEAAKRTAHDAVEEASRLKSLFMATMSHEIRTPINAVMGYVDLLDLEIAGPLTEKQRQHLVRIRASNLHLLGIIDEILEFSHLDANRVRVGRRMERFAIPIQAALQLVHPQSEAKGVELSYLVSGLEDVPYWGDEDRVRQILVVLLSNAVKFTPPKGRITVTAGTVENAPPDVQVERGDGGPWVYVRVEDTGPGIDPKRIKAIFEPFEQADMTLTRQYGGTGLGLTIAKRLARLMAGDVTVQSKEGVGSAFFLWLPSAGDEAFDRAMSRSTQMTSPNPKLMREVRDAILSELERLIHVYVARMKSDPATPSARALTEAELAEHLATFFTDLSYNFNYFDLATGTDADALRARLLIQRTAAQRHGQKRRQLDWTEEEVRREFEILREEVAAAITRRVRTESQEEMDSALDAVTHFITIAEEASLESHSRNL